MTTAGNFRSTVSRAEHGIPIAGVPWPAYKLIALAIGVLVLLIVGVATMSIAPAVLSGAAAATIAWLVLGTASSSHSSDR
ncbi:hypothetical protein M1247_07385 [Mycobacterium sp. 21AC1]|uniref:hypothetical protein n=1 Tax=[Mycobacterium] appelbergii TaxID=2939269 RepID=UPI00293923B5|nr:hypothetical protein [Mycobacterium sp. 21AC1]MDV3124731.1 hypothetical protein [Mycobacterium sp. 21AC1]